MAQHPAERLEPVVAALVAAVLPGGGLIYAGRGGAGVRVFVAELLLFAFGFPLTALVLHVAQILVSGGAAWEAGERGVDVFAGRDAPEPA
mgnify:CR=1 FL=1